MGEEEEGRRTKEKKEKFKYGIYICLETSYVMFGTSPLFGN